MGLLSRASFISDKVELAFSEFILKYNIQTFAVFELKDNNFYIKNSIGFDGNSLIISLSTKDFWDGLCPSCNNEYNFSFEAKNINPILQFFSFEIRDDIKSISIYRTENNIFMLCNKEFNREIIDDLLYVDYSLSKIDLNNVNKEITKDSKVFMYEVDFSEAVETYLAMKPKSQLNEELLKSSIYNELVNRCSCYFSKYGTKRLSESSVRVLLNVDRLIHEDHLICHIVFYLNTVIDNAAELICFENKGIANSLIEIKEFLQVE